MKEIVTVLLLAEIVFIITQNLKAITDKHTGIVALIVGAATAVIAQADLLAFLGFRVRSDLAGQILTGLAIAGGAGILFEAFKKWGLLKQE